MLSLETDRLIIRSFRLDDWPDLRELSIRYQATEAARYEDPWPTSEEGVRGMAEWLSVRDDYLAVCLKGTGRLIGLIAIDRRRDQAERVHNLGYVFSPEYHGRGYALESCRATMVYVFGELAADGILTGTNVANAASIRLLRKLGLREREAAPGEYAISRSEWLAFAREGESG